MRFHTEFDLIVFSSAKTFYDGFICAFEVGTKKGMHVKKYLKLIKKKKITAVSSSLRWTNRLGRSEYKKVLKSLKLIKFQFI